MPAEIVLPHRIAAKLRVHRDFAAIVDVLWWTPEQEVRRVC